MFLVRKPTNLILCSCLFWLATITISAAGIPGFQHIVIIVQENRTPDNLFQDLCVSANSCSTKPNANQYDIQTTDWLDKTEKIQPGPVPLANTFDLGHSHSAFVAMCDRNKATGECAMDGAAGTGCFPESGTTCPQNPEFMYVDNSTGILIPYLELATRYGWANYMFQTNQGPSYPAHQFLFGATSARNAASDHAGIFASENVKGALGCAYAGTKTVQLINAEGVEGNADRTPTCFYHNTLAGLLNAKHDTWRYYTTGLNTIWTAPNSINGICVPVNGTCTGAQWKDDVDNNSSDVFSDIAKCSLRNVSWVIPTGQNSDHAADNTGGGPSWVASIVNAIGTSTCRNGDKSTYWDSTAIIITWDDWGGWYDHVAAPGLPYPEGGYQYGFRVPLIVVSAYTPRGYINNYEHDFGSIAKFVEHNFGINEGALTFADSRGQMGDLTEFFQLDREPRPYFLIPTRLNAEYFMNDKTPPADPDDD